MKKIRLSKITDIIGTVLFFLFILFLIGLTVCFVTPKEQDNYNRLMFLWLPFILLLMLIHIISSEDIGYYLLVDDKKITLCRFGKIRKSFIWSDCKISYSIYRLRASNNPCLLISDTKFTDISVNGLKYSKRKDYCTIILSKQILSVILSAYNQEIYLPLKEEVLNVYGAVTGKQLAIEYYDLIEQHNKSVLR